MFSVLMATAIAFGQANPPASNPSANVGPPTVRAVARRNLATYVRATDYPPDAWNRNEQGNVQFELAVSPTGRAIDCRIVRSSGSDLLDAKTCEIMLRRALFRPARDAAGNAVADMVRSTIGWFIAG